MQQISDDSNAFCCKDCIVELNSDRENKREKEGKRLWFEHGNSEWYPFAACVYTNN